MSVVKTPADVLWGHLCMQNALSMAKASSALKLRSKCVGPPQKKNASPRLLWSVLATKTGGVTDTAIIVCYVYVPPGRLDAEHRDRTDAVDQEPP